MPRWRFAASTRTIEIQPGLAVVGQAPPPSRSRRPPSSRTPNVAPGSDEEATSRRRSGSSRRRRRARARRRRRRRAEPLDREHLRTRHREPRTWSACRSWCRRRAPSRRPSRACGRAARAGSRTAAAAALVSESSAVGASWPTTLASMPSRAASWCASQRIEIVSGPVTLIGVVGVVRAREAAQDLRVGVALPDDVDVAHGDVDRLAALHLRGDVEEDAVAHVDRVVEADDAARRAVLAPRSTRTCARGRGTTARIRRPAPAASTRSRRRGRPAPGRRRCRSRRRRCATRGSARRRAPARARSSPRSAPALPLAPNLWPAAKITFGASGSAAIGGAVEQVAGDRLDAVRRELVAHRAVAEAGDADDAPRRRGALGQARQRRPHLAGDAEDQEVAFDGAELVDQGAVGRVRNSSSASTDAKRSGRAEGSRNSTGGPRSFAPV